MINRREILAGAAALPLLPVLSTIEAPPKLDTLNLFKKAYQQNIICYDKDARCGLFTKKLLEIINNTSPTPKHEIKDIFILQDPTKVVKFSYIQPSLKFRYKFISQPEFFGKCDIFFSLKQYNKKYLGIAINSNQDVMMFMY